MESNNLKKMIQQGFDGVAAVYEHSSLSFFSETIKPKSIKEQFYAALHGLLNQLSEHEHRKEIVELLRCDGVWFNTNVLIAVREM